MKAVRNTVDDADDVKFIIATMVRPGGQLLPGAAF